MHRGSVKRLMVAGSCLGVAGVMAACGSTSSTSPTASSGGGGGVPNVSVTSFDSSFSVMSQFKSLASSGKGLVGVILPDTTSSTRYVSFDQPYLQNRYLYAIGGNPEAARRAGVNLARIRTIAFALCAATAGAAGLLYLSLLDGMSNNVPGGQYVLYAVAAAVIGGTSLFGGRGKVIHGVIGGLVIGAIANGMGLLGLDVQVQFIVTGLVLLVAVTIDALSRRAATSGSAARA